MSDAVKPALHGRDHCPGGVDPIPCLASEAPRARGKVLTTRTIGANALTALMGDTTTVFDEELNDDATLFTFATASGNGRGIRVVEDGLYTLICRVACGSLASPFIIDFNHFQSGDLTYELYSYPMSVDQLAVDTRLAGYACLTQRIEAATTVVAMLQHTGTPSKTIVEGSFFEIVKHPATVLSTDDLSWP